MKFVLIALLGAAAAAAFNVNSDNVNAALQFNEFMTKFNKKYESTAEYDTAFGNFKSTLKRLDSYKQKGRAGYGITKFADLSREEFRSKYLMPKGNAAMNIKEMKSRFAVDPHNSHKHAKAKSDPTAFNWVAEGATTPVKDQQQCGSCWAFSTTENFESMWYLKHKKTIKTPPVLGPQQLVDCDPQSQGCGGGWTYWAFEYLMTAGGQELESDYPYQAVNGNCQFDASKIAARLLNYTFATVPCESGSCSPQDDLLKSQLLATGPLSVCVDAESWSDWTGPTPMSSLECPGDAEDIDHCVQLVGYDFSNANNKYWILRNSWNTDWGQEGFMYLQYGHNTCGLGDVATYADIKM
jgi:cathepsin F